MKYIFALLFSFAALSAAAQTWNPVTGRWEYSYMKVTTGFIPPPDTLNIAPQGSVTLKNGVWYEKTATKWVPFTNQEEIDVFIVGGQSNARGSASVATGYAALDGKVMQFVNNSLIPVTDNTNNNTWKSPWPSFATNYYTLTGRKICIVNRIATGSTQTIAAGTPFGLPNWDTTGTLFQRTLDTARAAMNYIASQGYTPVLKGILWIQGESDGAAIAAGTIDSTAYRLAFAKMIRRFRDSLGRNLPFYIWKTGYYTAAYQPGEVQVQAIQQNMANTDSLTTMVFYNTPDFVSRNLFNGTDTVHWNIQACNEAGKIGVQNMLAASGYTWQTQTNNVYFPRGSVGIGVSTPVHRLQVDGNSGINGKLYANNISVTGIINIPATTGLTVGTITQDSASLLHTFGSNNLFLGKSVGNFTNSGTGGNTAIGSNVMTTLTTATFNTGVGRSALSSVTSGGGNTAIGVGALDIITTATANTAIGQNAGGQRAGGDNNVYAGRDAGGGTGSQTGNNNVYAGRSAGAGVTGDGNILVGYQAGFLGGSLSNRLYLSNSNTTSPLVYGEFDNNILAVSPIGSKFGVGKKAPVYNLDVSGTGRFTDTLFANSRLGVGVSPTALLHLNAGTAAATTAPLKFSTGTNLTTAESGVVEYNGAFYATKASTLRFALNGVIADFTTDVSNSSTSETDLYTYITPASTLSGTGEKITADWAGIFNANLNATIKVYFAGTEIFTSSAVPTESGSSWTVKTVLIRTGANTARAVTTFTYYDTSLSIYVPKVKQTDLTGLTFSNTNIIKITGQGTASTQITAKLGAISWHGAAAN